MVHPLAALLDRLEQAHGPVDPPPARTALGWVLWVRVAYLVSDAKRALAFEALEQRVGLTAAELRAAPRETLLEVARLGGMHPDRRAGELLDVALEVEDSCGGDLDTALDAEPERAVRILKRFRGIGEPGAEWILVATGRAKHAALESNGLRVLTRLGLVEERQDYARTYRAAREALTPLLGKGCDWLARMHLLLRRHGQGLCKHSDPRCEECPLADTCEYARTQA